MLIDLKDLLGRTEEMKATSKQIIHGKEIIKIFG